MPKSRDNARLARLNGDRTSLSVRLRDQLAVLQRRLDQAAAALSAAVTPAAIHNTRVAARRLRVLLRAHRKELDLERRKQYQRELQKLTRDLETARDAYVTRQAIARLARDRHGNMDGDSRALFESAVKGYESAVLGLRLTMAADDWQQRLTALHLLSVHPSLVMENEDMTASVMLRPIKRRRRRLRDGLRGIGRNPRKLHKIRLKIKALRYLLESGFSKGAMARNSEVKHLRRMQSCLGDMHDEENLLKDLRTEQRDSTAARAIAKKLIARKNQHIQEFRKQRRILRRLWDGAA